MGPLETYIKSIASSVNQGACDRYRTFVVILIFTVLFIPPLIWKVSTNAKVVPVNFGDVLDCIESSNNKGTVSIEL